MYQTTDNFLLFDELAIFVQKTSERKIVLEHHLQITGNPLKRFLISETIGTSEPTNTKDKRISMPRKQRNKLINHSLACSIYLSF